MKNWIFALLAFILVYAIATPVFNLITVIGIVLITAAVFIAVRIFYARTKRK